MKIGLLGCGVVGGQVLQLVDNLVPQHQIKRILVKTEEEICNPRMTVDVNAILNDKGIGIIIECMGGIEPAFSYVKKALQQKKHVITSNKKMLASHAEELFAIAKKNRCTLRYEASVGGGIPWIHELEHIKQLDEIASFQGIFNGTTNYILTAMQETAVTFDACLKEAQQKGYAEQDPTDDIDGYDVRYKVALSILTAFDGLVDIDTIPRFGIRHLTRQDIKWANKHGYVVRLIGRATRHNQSITASVIPMFVTKNSIFANINQNLNGMCATSNTLGTSAYIGQGAGGLPTAHAVVQDLLDLEHILQKSLVKYPIQNRTKKMFYVHTKKEDVWHPYIKEQVQKNCFLTVPMTIATVQSLTKKDEDCFVAEVEDD